MTFKSYLYTTIVLGGFLCVAHDNGSFEFWVCVFSYLYFQMTFTGVFWSFNYIFLRWNNSLVLIYFYVPILKLYFAYSYAKSHTCPSQHLFYCLSNVEHKENVGLPMYLYQIFGYMYTGQR